MKMKMVVGDTYLEPTFLPHTYSLVDKTPSQILSYTAKSQLQKFVDNSNLWPVSSIKFAKILNYMEIIFF